MVVVIIGLVLDEMFFVGDGGGGIHVTVVTVVVNPRILHSLVKNGSVTA